MRRRSVLSLLGLGGVGVLTAKGLSGCIAPGGSSRAAKAFPFQPVRVPLPVNSDGLQASEQQSTYRELALEDRLTVPDGFASQLLAAWGDPLGDSRFGFNNDHLGFVQQGPDRASMTVNFEYISAVPWVQGLPRWWVVLCLLPPWSRPSSPAMASSTARRCLPAIAGCSRSVPSRMKR